MRENAEAKALRLLTQGRVFIRSVTSIAVVADVRGDEGALYLVVGEAQGWSCSCPAVGRCSHALAVARVTLRPLPQDGPGPSGIPGAGAGGRRVGKIHDAHECAAGWRANAHHSPGAGHP